MLEAQRAEPTTRLELDQVNARPRTAMGGASFGQRNNSFSGGPALANTQKIETLRKSGSHHHNPRYLTGSALPFSSLAKDALKARFPSAKGMRYRSVLAVALDGRPIRGRSLVRRRRWRNNFDLHVIFGSTACRDHKKLGVAGLSLAVATSAL
jgi:hypothetical protein